jgi:hypothetical protein
MARFITRTESYVSHHYVAKLWRETGIRPHHSGTFKVSKDPAFAEKVADVIGLYLEPRGGAVVLLIDEKTQIQALDRTQPVLPITFDATEKRTHDYVRHGTTNLFAALNMGNGQVYGEYKPTRTARTSWPSCGKRSSRTSAPNVHVVLDNLSTHATREVAAWLRDNPHVHFHFTRSGRRGSTRSRRAVAAGWEFTRNPNGKIANLAKKPAFVNHYSFQIISPD